MGGDRGGRGGGGGARGKTACSLPPLSAVRADSMVRTHQEDAEEIVVVVDVEEAWIVVGVVEVVGTSVVAKQRVSGTRSRLCKEWTTLRL